MRPSTLPRCAPPPRRPSGFSLIELMVAMVIGMAAVIVMMQMLLNSDTAKRVTVSGNDAQITGTIALFNLERDIRTAGYGITAPQILGCTLHFAPTEDAKDTVTLTLGPVLLNPGNDVIPAGDAASDTLLVISGSAEESPEGDPLVATTTEDTYTVTTPSAFRRGDQVVAQTLARPTPCALTLSTVTAVGGSALGVQGGVSGMPTGSVVFNLRRLVARAYAVRDGRLTVCDYARFHCGKAGHLGDEEVWVPVADNVLSILAQYGQDLKDTSKEMTGAISEYGRTQPGMGAKDKALPPQCAWARAVSVRVGLLARGTHYDKNLDDPRQQAAARPPTWSGASGPLNAAPADFDLTGTVSDWQRYRYKSFETHIPLRNTLWQGDTDC